jgi:hypothetical protein
MMNSESELDRWRSAWTTGAHVEVAAPFDLSAAHRRQERRLRIHYILNVVVAIVLIVFAALVLRRNPRAEVLAWAVVVWLTTLGSTAFYVWNWRALWRTTAKSVLDYADMCETRCTATLRAVHFGYAFLALQFAIAAPWLTWDFAHRQILAVRYAFCLALLGTLTVAFIIWFRRSRQRALLELTQIKEFRRALCDDDA